MAKYKLTKNIDTGVVDKVTLTEGNVKYRINFNPESHLYQEYLEWVAEGNTADDPDGLTWNDIRAKRDSILQSTDWTMITGATVDQAQWAAYRQVIRDIPQTYKDKTPDDVVWPTQPSTAGPNT